MFQTAGDTILIDAGPKKLNSDAGDKIVLPDLDRLGSEGVDLIMLSHPDEDHVGGTDAILRAYPHAKIVMSADFKGYPAMEKHLQSWNLTDKDVVWLGPHARLNVGEFALTIDDPFLLPGANDNSGSMFIHIVGPAGSAVFSGDADKQTEEEMEPLENWKAQVMKVGHHGSKTATDQTWLAAVQPKYAVISCGLNNPYGHPAPQTVDRLSAAGIKIFRTDRQGDIEFDYDEAKGFVPEEKPYTG